MAEGRYSRIKSKFWTDEKSGKWDDSTKLLALYLLTSPHINILGCYVLPKGYICEDLGWTMEQLAKPFAKLLADEFIKYDETNKLLLISNYLKHNPIENRNQAIAAMKQLKELPRSPLIADLQRLCEPFRKLFDKQFNEQFAERIGKPVTVTVTESVTIDDSLFSSSSELENKDRAGLAGSADNPNNAELIAELVREYRKVIPPEKHQKGDYAFIGRLYNEFGYDTVLSAINEFGYKVESGFIPDQPLVYLKGIVKKDRASPSKVVKLPQTQIQVGNIIADPDTHAQLARHRQREMELKRAREQKQAEATGDHGPAP